MSEQILHFLEQHVNADVIEVDSSGVPIRAIYTTLKGIPRTYPAEFWFERWLEEGEEKEI